MEDEQEAPLTGISADTISVGPRSSVFVVVLTLILGAASTILGILAMVSTKQNPQVSSEANVSIPLNCQYQTSTATTLGLVAGLVLAVAMAFVSVLGGCVCCVTMTYSMGNALRVSIAAFIVTWVCFFIAELCFMTGGYVNSFHMGITNYQWDFQLRVCYRTKMTSYLIGAICSLLTSFFAIVYYGQAQKSKYEAWVEQGAPTPRIYSLETMKSFVIAGPARKGPLKTDDDEEDEYDVFDETQPLHPDASS